MLKTVLAVAAIQLGIALIAGALLGGVFGSRVGISALAGGAVAAVGSVAYLATWSMVSFGGRRTGAHLRAHVLGELSKVVAVSAGLLWVLSGYGKQMSAAAFLGVFVATLLAAWFGLALKNKG